LRTSFEAGVARRAEPDERTGENLLLHAEKGHPDDFSRIISVRHLSDWASCRAGAAGKTFLDIFSPWLGGDKKFKIWIKGFGINHETGTE
jgi:hypothetical protein